MDPIALRQQVRDLVESTVQGLGYDLVAVEWVGGAMGPVLRLSIESPSGIDADDCATVSEHVSPILDESDPINVRYFLEVSSPGIDRPLQRASDFERFLGYRVKMRLVEGPPRRRYAGLIGPVDGEEVTVVVDGAEHRIPLDTVERAHLVLDLDEYKKLAEGAP